MGKKRNYLSSFFLQKSILILFAGLGIFPLQAQEIDTSQLIKIIQSNQTEPPKFEAYRELCSFYRKQKDYSQLEKTAIAYYDLSNKAKSTSESVEALYYLVLANYYLKDSDGFAEYSEIAIQQAEKAEEFDKLAFFYNIQGVYLRRLDKCDEAIDKYLKAVQINQEIKDSIELGKNYNNLAICYSNTGLYAKAFEILNEALEIKRSQADTIGIGNLYMNIGNNYDNVYNYEKAIENFLLAQEYFELANDSIRRAGSLFNTGLVYHNLKNYEQAIKYYQQVKEITEKIGHTSLLGTAFQNLGNVYSDLSEPQKSITNHQMALKIFESKEMVRDMNDVYLNLGIEYSKINKYDSSLYFLDKSFQICKQTDDLNQLSNVYLEKGRLYSKLGNFKEAMDNLNKGEKLAIELDDKNLLQYANLYMYEMFEKTGQASQALSYFKKYQNIRDSLDLMDQEKSVTAIKASYDFEKQENEIQLLNTENELKEAEVIKYNNHRKFLTALLLLFGIVIGGITFLFFYSRKKNAIITREKDKAENLLLNILPPKTAKELTDNGFVKAQRYDEATVLFTDFVQFSSFSKTISPEEVVRNVDFYFRNFDRISEKYGLEKIKTIGDAYMCVGGLPEISKDHPIRSVMAAKEIIRFVREIQASPPQGIHPFGIRIGINTGPVVAGVVGTKKFQYDIWGDTVNLASKMESSARNGTIAISEFTYEKVKDHIECLHRGEVEIKNYITANTYEIIL